MISIKNNFKSYILTASLVSLFWGTVVQSVTINFWLDYCTFKQPSEATNVVELYYAVPFSDLAFVRLNNKLRAEFLLKLSIYDKEGRLVIDREWVQSFLINTYEDVHSAKEFIGKAIAEFKPGVYKVVAFISDRNSVGKAQTEKELVVEEFGKRLLELSGLKLSKKVNNSIVPNPKLIFEDNLYLAYEIYFNQEGIAGTSEDTIQLKYSIYEMNEQNPIILRQSKVKLDELVKVDERFDLFDLADGHYVIKVDAQIDTFYTSKEKRFSIKKPTYNYSLGGNFSEDLRLLKYVATKKELKELKKLKLKTADERASYLESFWKQRDPTPRTSRNELFEEFSRRVRFADKNFSVAQKKGWQTDRGHVYILLGEPYAVRDLPFELGQKPCQIWTYAKYGDFTFEDEWQTGDYRLVEGWDRLPRKFIYK